MHINPYLQFSGNCADAFKFYENALDGKDLMMMPYEDAPAQDGQTQEMRGKIMHAHLMVGSVSLMGSDCPPQFFQKPQGFNVSLQVDTEAEAEKLYAALSEGGDIRMAMQETFWATRFAIFSDKFGTPWMINCQKPMGQ